MKEINDDSVNDFRDLEDRIKKLVEKHIPGASWVFLLLKDKEILEGKVPQDREGTAFMVSHSHTPADAIILTTLGVKCMLFSSSDEQRGKAIDIIGNLINSDDDLVSPNFKNGSTNSRSLFDKDDEFIKDVKGAGSIKNYLKNRMRKKD